MCYIEEIKRMKSKKTSSNQVLCAVVALFTAVTFSVHAESKSGKSIVENASNYAKTVPAFELEVALKLKITADGEASEQEVGYSIAHQRPDKFSVRI